MKKRVTFLVGALILMMVQFAFGQHTVRLGDLPKSDFTINVFQVVGFQEAAEGYKLLYLDNNYDLKYLYLPGQLRDKYQIYKPQGNSQGMNFIIIWQKDNKIKRIEWFMPPVINYKLPNYAFKPFGEKDKEIFKKIVSKGELVFSEEIGGLAPLIRAPGGGE